MKLLEIYDEEDGYIYINPLQVCSVEGFNDVFEIKMSNGEKYRVGYDEWESVDDFLADLERFSRN